MTFHALSLLEHLRPHLPSSISADELFSCLVEQKAFKYSEQGLPGGPVVKTLPFTVEGTGSILGLEAKIPYD